jgi:hypothetical protein
MASDETSSESDRKELRDAPPFLTWRAIYLIVVGALAIEIGLGVLVTIRFP